MKKLFKILLPLFVAFIVLPSCNETVVEETFDVEFNVPSSVTFEEGDDRSIDFKVLFKKAPKETDVLILALGKDKIECPITAVNQTKFTVQLPADIAAATYDVLLRRGNQEKSFGKLKIVISKPGEFAPAATTTVWGVVSSGSQPLAGVVVSDGIDVAVTNADGIYELDSDKELGYVFISIPSGYEVENNGVLPQFSKLLASRADVLEQVDFELTKVDGQDNYKMLFFGDMHLANRTDDKAQFAEFTADVKKFIAANPNDKFYALTLGDMTWDLYWYSNHYEFPQYIEEINRGLKGLTIFHTMGNHDNDFKAYGDFDAATQYVKSLCPTYYSFNIGKVHYVVLDDIESLADGTTDRKYNKTLTTKQLEWLKKDLKHVSKNTPLVVTAHAQFFYPNTASNFKIDHSAETTRQFFNIVQGYETHIVTGHTHTIFNVCPQDAKSLGADNVYEHNSGSVCGSWWWSGHLTDGVHLGQDGSPGGYSIWDITGTDLKWVYKATNWDESYQFRAYDLNNISFSFSDVPKMSNATVLVNAFQKYVNAYPGTQSNEVLINIWNWSKDWKLTVIDQSGKELKWTQVFAYDPLHIAALSVKRFNSSSIKSVPSFVTEANMCHFFKVTASDPNEDLVIKVTDKFGNVYTENMARPKEFKISEYSK